MLLLTAKADKAGNSSMGWKKAGFGRLGGAHSPGAGVVVVEEEVAATAAGLGS